MKTCKYFLLALLAVICVASQAGEPILIPLKIDGPVHDPANHTYCHRCRKPIARPSASPMPSTVSSNRNRSSGRMM